MNNYFTSIENVNDKFVGSVHDANTNQLVFRSSQPHNTPAEAIVEVNNFLQQSSLPSTQTQTNQPSISPVSQPEAVTPPPQRCCGR